METNVVGRDVEIEGATLVAGAMVGLGPAPGSESVWELIDADLLDALGFEGKVGQVISLPHPEAEALVITGLGEEVGLDVVRAASGEAARRVKTSRAVTLLASIGLDGATRAVAEGALLGAYQYTNYKTSSEPMDLLTLDIVDADPAEAAAAQLMAQATMLARDWVNTPAKDKSPSALAQLVADAAADAPVEVEIWDREKIEQEALGGLLGVAAGSDREPRVVFVSYTPEDARANIALVGKGIIFDTGGLSLKTAAFMEEMKDDMAGAAAVCAAAIGIARMGIPVAVTAIAPLTDNAVGGDATRPGDVLRPVEGPTIEVLNTDAEGRLILADGLGLAKRFAPDLTIDVATLTGAAAVALGKEVAAVFASDSDVADTVLDAAGRAGENFWQLPLHKGYRESIDSEIADIKNVSGNRYGGAIVAALFLAEYAGDGPWAHLDIAGPARSKRTLGELVKGASGVGVRTLIEVARQMAEAD